MRKYLIRGRFLGGDKRGNAMVSFALSFAIIFPLISGSYQFGYAFYIYNEMQTAVRGGARYASLRTYDSASDLPSQEYEDAVRNMVVYGDPSGGTRPVVPQLALDQVSVTMSFERGTPRRVTVGIASYQEDAVFGLLDFRTKPEMTVNYVGRWAAVN